MKVEKMREWTADELRTKEREFSDQLFRLKFQMASGQTDTLQKIRVLRKDIARVKTLLRESQGKAEAVKKS
ncbi:MAG: 50S ribosomal protein L29 [Terriglobia bacterium]|jgi:large subunit ribosomal protein L29